MADHIIDDTERAYTLMAFPTVNRWGQLKAMAPGATDIDLRGGNGLTHVPSVLSTGVYNCVCVHDRLKVSGGGWIGVGC